MSSGKAIWATGAGLTVGENSRGYTKSVATTALGHVITAFDERDDKGAWQGKLAKFDGSSGAKVWGVSYGTMYGDYGLAVEGDPIDEVAYVTGKLVGTDVDPFGTGTNLTATKGDVVIAALDVSGADGPSPSGSSKSAEVQALRSSPMAITCTSPAPSLPAHGRLAPAP